MLSLGGLIGQLWEDVRALVQAEIGLVQSRASDLLRRSRTAALLIGVAIFFVLASVMALMLGLVLALLPLVGPALAGLILCLIGLAFAGFLAWIAIRLFKRPSETPETTP